MSDGVERQMKKKDDICLEERVQGEKEKRPVLERLVGKARYERWKGSPVYELVVDTSVAVIAPAVVAAPIEYFVLDMDCGKVAAARGLCAVFNGATGRLYSKYRNWVFRKLKTTEESSWVKKCLSDMLVFGTSWGPAYAGILAVSGGSTEQVAGGAGIALALAGLAGILYGKALNFTRRLCGLKTAEELALNDDNSVKIKRY